MWPYTNTEATLSRYAYVYMNEESTCTFVHMYVFMYNECIRYDVTCQVAVHGNYAGGEGEGQQDRRCQDGYFSTAFGSGYNDYSILQLLMTWQFHQPLLVSLTIKRKKLYF